MSPHLASPTALLNHLGVSLAELEKIRWFRNRMYSEFEIAGRSGKKRIIHAPNPRLKHLQRKIILLLAPLYRARDPVHGFVEGRSVKSNAAAHLRKRFVLNVDLQDFFPSITEKRVVGVLESLDVNATVAKVIGIICCNRGYLPQGAPTSPLLSNMICFRLDRRLMQIAKEARCIYTRYADDITFSGFQPLSPLFDGAIPPIGHFPPDKLSDALRTAFAGNGFMLNSKKSHYADRYSRRMVTGIKVNELLNVDRRFVRNIRAILYSIENEGIELAQKKYTAKFKKNTDLKDHLRGKLIWLRHIRGQSDPVYRANAVRFNRCFPAYTIEIEPTLQEIRDRALWVIDCETKNKINPTAQGSRLLS